jgi:MFS family permease
MLVGAVSESVGLVCASLSTQIWHLFLSQGVLFGIGMGMLFLPSYGVISQWFTKRRALANGIAIAGAGLGGFVYSLSAGAIIRNLSIDWAYRILAIVSAVVNLVCALLMRTRYAARPLAFDWSLLKGKEYLVILGYGFMSMLGYFVLIFTLANYANVIGLDASQAAWIPALFMLGQAIGRPILGWLSDLYGHIQVTSFMSLLCGISSLAIWLNAESFGSLIAFALVAGLVGGVFWVTAAPIVAQVVGLDNLPSGLTILWVTLALPSTFSSSIALEIFEETGKYMGAQIFTGVAFIAAGLCMAYLWWLQLVKS